ncbi:MAG: bifunctional lysine ketoglutarate reductase /saccharopine dehydrogenase family protein [Phycisphaerae bacterium]
MNVIGIRHEDKSEWERRTPLVPADVQELVQAAGVPFHVQSSPIRAFRDEEYRLAGASVSGDLADCPIIMGVKEIPPEKIAPEKTYVYFSHTIKGQASNMPALQRLLDLRCQLIDYERITDGAGRRLVFFGRFAGLAGMIDTLWSLGRRLEHEGLETPFVRLQPAHEYATLDHAKKEMRLIGEAIRNGGLPGTVTPLVCGFAGYGQVSGGAQEIYDLLGVETVAPEDLAAIPRGERCCYKVVFREEHLVSRRDDSSPFELQEYYDHPERYRDAFFPHVRDLSILVNCIYWEPKYPRLITRDQLRELYSPGSSPHLRVIGDITCDVDGPLACTVRATTPDSPIYVYDPRTGETLDGVAGDGPVVLAVDFLPCELPAESSEFFSGALKPLIPTLARADFTVDLRQSGLSPELERATIVYQGRLTDAYRYLAEFL